MPSSNAPALIEALGLDPRRAADIVAEALLPMDDGELFVERSRSETLAFDDGRLRTASRDASRGFGLRAVSGERVGLACGAEIDEAALRRAASTVAAVARGHAGRDNAPIPPAGLPLYPGDDPLGGEPQSQRIALLQEIDAYCRAAGDDVRQVSVSLLSGHQEIEVLRGDGRRVADARPLVRLNVQVVVERNGRRESGGHGAGGRLPLAGMLAETGWRTVADEALRQARLKLDAVPAPAGEMTVVLGPGWPGVMLHEAVGHGLEGDFNRKGTSAFAGLLGERVAAPGVTVVDDGTLPGRRGSLTVDDEGTPSGRAVLIEDGARPSSNTSALAQCGQPSRTNTSTTGLPAFAAGVAPACVVPANAGTETAHIRQATRSQRTPVVGIPSKSVPGFNAGDIAISTPSSVHHRRGAPAVVGRTSASAGR